MTQSERDSSLPEPSKAMVQRRLNGDQHCLKGARDEMLAVDLRKQELSQEMNPQSSLAHGNVGESPADELP